MTDQASPTITRTDWLLIAILVALVLPLRLWLLHNTEVTARDSIGYIRYALQFEDADWREVCKKSDQHPGYPALVWLMSQPIRALDGETTPRNMQLATQLVSLLASLLLIVPTYFLGRQFFDRGVSLGAALLYQYFPVSGQHLSDGISEPAYLVFLTTALWQGVCAVRERSPWRCGLCGLFVGASYLVRPEAIVLLAALGLVVIVLQFRATWRAPWPRFASCGAAAVVGVMLTGSIYVYATGQFSKKPAINYMLGKVYKLVTRTQEGARLPARPTTRLALIGSAGPLFAATFPTTDDKTILLGRSTAALTTEIVQGFHYIGVVPAVLGFWWAFGPMKRQVGFWFLLSYAGLHAIGLLALAMSVQYVSDRHVMILVLGGTYFSSFGLIETARRLTAWWNTPEESIAHPWRSAWLWATLAFVVFIAICLPKTTQRLHGNRAGNHHAGLWLAEHWKVGDVIVDDHAWSHYFAGMVFQEGRDPTLPKDHQGTCYVVTTRSNDPSIDAQRLAANLTADARIVYQWPEHVDAAKARVLVHAQPRDYKTHKWRIAR